MLDCLKQQLCLSHHHVAACRTARRVDRGRALVPLHNQPLLLHLVVDQRSRSSASVVPSWSYVATSRGCCCSRTRCRYIPRRRPRGGCRILLLVRSRTPHPWTHRTSLERVASSPPAHKRRPASVRCPSTRPHLGHLVMARSSSS